MVSVLVFQTKIHKIIQNQNQTSPMHAPHPNEIQDFSSCYTNILVIDLCAQQGEGEQGRSEGEASRGLGPCKNIFFFLGVKQKCELIDIKTVDTCRVKRTKG